MHDARGQGSPACGSAWTASSPRARAPVPWSVFPPATIRAHVQLSGHGPPLRLLPPAVDATSAAQALPGLAGRGAERQRPPRCGGEARPSLLWTMSRQGRVRA